MYDAGYNIRYIKRTSLISLLLFNILNSMVLRFLIESSLNRDILY